ncbi:uncharacterized protein LOC117648400 [Thrips palmi]|uniref:Uncharacterized protein LOC117648400 n=1 Tax=Thrips palmi TaxID=161013 RepID=A0A6P8Z2T2_THRPL|nr:uncharacterized protein LOC117648400 [Thrips palmi]
MNDGKTINISMEDFDELNDSGNTNVWEDISFFDDLDDLDTVTVEVATDATDSTPQRQRKPRKPRPSLNIKCGRCPASRHKFATVSGYAEHLKSHAWDDIKSRLASEETFCGWARELGPKALKDLGAQPRTSTGFGPATTSFIEGIDCHSQEWAQFIDFVSENLVRPIHKYISLLPSHLLEKSQSSVLRFLANADTRAQAHFLLSRCHSEETPAVVVSVVCQKVVFRVVELTVAQHVKRMKDSASTRRAISRITGRVIKVIHHCGGSVVKGLLRKCFRYRHDPWWNQVTEVVRGNFIPGASESPLEGGASEWTDVLNRGGLTLISKNALAFFKSLAEILGDMEKQDRIASHVQLIQAVYKSQDAMKKWDELCQGSLPHKDSLHLMVLVSRGFCNTFSRGVIRKRLNKTKKFTSVPLRPRMAR